MPCSVAWFTGLSGSGKTTIANRTSEKLTNSGYQVKTLDGDIVRTQLHRQLGFSRADIEENNRLICGLCKDSVTEFDVILVPIISPFRASRKAASEVLGDAFEEVYVYASLPEVIRRDPKGLYEKERHGQMPGLIGIAEDVPYEPPECPGLLLDTESHDAEACSDQLVEYLKVRLESA